MSHWPPPPPFMRLTISSDDPAYFALTLHPVLAVNCFTHESSTYPSHAIRLSWPSPAPTEVGGFMPAVGGCAAVEPPVVVFEPHAVIVITAAAASVPSRTHMAGASVDLILPTSPCLSLPPRVSVRAAAVDRARKYARAPTRAVSGGPRSAAHRPPSPYSGARPPAARRGRGGRCSGSTAPRR